MTTTSINERNDMFCYNMLSFFNLALLKIISSFFCERTPSLRALIRHARSTSVWTMRTTAARHVAAAIDRFHNRWPRFVVGVQSSVVRLVVFFLNFLLR